MSFFPYNTNVTQHAQTDVTGTTTYLGRVVRYHCTPAAAVANHYVTSTDMKVGAYTLAHTSPGDGCAHNVTVAQTITNAAEDTNGTIVVVGTDLAGNAISETITPNGGATVAGAKAFATITSITGAGWIINGADEDTVVIGFGDVVGLPDKLAMNTVLMAALNGTREATAPTVVASSTVLSSNTFDLDTALDGNNVDVIYIV